MMDFESIVEKVLLSEMTPPAAPGTPAPVTPGTPATPAAPAVSTPGTPTPATTPTPADDDVLAKSAKEYLTTKKGKIASAYLKAFPIEKFGVDLFPAQQFDTIVYNVNKNSIRSTKDYTQIPKFVVAYPLLDLAAQIKQVYVEKRGSVEADKVLDAWVTTLTKGGIATPIDFPATDPWAISVKQAYEKANNKSTNVGALKLDAYGAVSIADGIYKLMAQRASPGLWKLPKDEFEPSQLGQNINKFLEDIIINPQGYTQGVIPYPDKKLSVVYGDETPTMVRNAANAAYALFDQQLTEKVLRHQSNEAYEISPSIFDNFETFTLNKVAKQEIYKLFLYNTLDWNRYRKLKATPAVESFDDIFDSAYRIFLQERTTESYPLGKVEYRIETDAASKTITATDKTSNKQYIIPTNDIIKAINKDPIAREEIKVFMNIENKKANPSTPTFKTPDEAAFSWLEAGSGPNGTEEKILNNLIKNKIRAATRPSRAKDSAGDPAGDPATAGEELSDVTQVSETFLEGKYSIADIIKYKPENKQAEFLVNALEAIADSVRKSFDLEKGFNAIAKAAKAFTSGLDIGGYR